MSYRVLGLFAMAVAVLATGPISIAQNQTAGDDWTAAAGETGASGLALPPYDPRDIGGYWSRGNPEGGPGRCVTSQGPCENRFFSIENWPIFTPEGQARFESYKPSYGRWKDTPDANAHPEEHIGYRRAVQPALGNDPQGTCNPLGSSRLTLFNQQSELTVLVDRIIQHVDQTNAWRTWWMDGRELPAPEEVDLPRWHGYSIARWEGDTLVVETANFNDQANYRGAGANLRLTERYTRVSGDTLGYEITVEDPTTWTGSWTAAFPMRPSDGLIYEYACHEGNYAMRNILAGARLQERLAE